MRLFVRALICCALSLAASPVFAQGSTPRLSSPQYKAVKSGALQAGQLNVLPDDADSVSQQVYTEGPETRFRGRQWTTRTAPNGPRSNYAFIGDNMVLIDPGSQRNGPNTAGYAKNISVLKKGFPSQGATSGEIDGILLNLRQAGPTPKTDADASDANAIQGNAQVAGDPGFLSFGEMQISRIEPTAPYTTTHSIRLQLGAIDPFGKNLELGATDRYYNGVHRLTFGYGAISDVGANDRAFYAVDNTSPWSTYFYAGHPGNPAVRLMGNSGAIRWGPDDSSWTIQRGGGGSLNFYSAGDILQGQINADGTTYWPAVTTNTVVVAGSPMLTPRKTVIYPPLTSFPASPVEGETIYSQQNRKVYTWDGTNWQAHW